MLLISNKKCFWILITNASEFRTSSDKDTNASEFRTSSDKDTNASDFRTSSDKDTNASANNKCFC